MVQDTTVSLHFDESELSELLNAFGASAAEASEALGHIRASARRCDLSRLFELSSDVAARHPAGHVTVRITPRPEVVGAGQLLTEASRLIREAEKVLFPAFVAERLKSEAEVQA